MESSRFTERDEQIDRAGYEAWKTYQQAHNNDTPDHSESFRMGAEWADKNPPKHDQPVFALKCSKCGCIYFAHVLGAPMNERTAEEIDYSIGIGDIAFVTSNKDLHLSCCDCDLRELGEKENYNEL